MPIFNFKCKDCGAMIENEIVPVKELKEKDAVTRECPKCKGIAEKQMGSPMFYFRRKNSY